MLLQILTHTPKWVFALFALLLALGIQQLFARRVSLARATIMPVAMTALSVAGVISAFGAASAALVVWALATVAVAALSLRRPLPASTRFDASTRSFQVAGSALPMALLMGIFSTKYAVGISLALHPELALSAAFALVIGALYGAFSGIFAARLLALWRLALGADGAATTSNPSVASSL